MALALVAGGCAAPRGAASPSVESDTDLFGEDDREDSRTLLTTGAVALGGGLNIALLSALSDPSFPDGGNQASDDAESKKHDKWVGIGMTVAAVGLVMVLVALPDAGNPRSEAQQASTASPSPKPSRAARTRNGSAMPLGIAF